MTREQLKFWLIVGQLWMALAAVRSIRGEDYSRLDTRRGTIGYSSDLVILPNPGRRYRDDCCNDGGQSGKNGKAGRDGRDGKDGQPGAPGPTGNKGPDGNKGPTGDKGPSGEAFDWSTLPADVRLSIVNAVLAKIPPTTVKFLDRTKFGGKIVHRTVIIPVGGTLEIEPVMIQRKDTTGANKGKLATAPNGNIVFLKDTFEVVNLKEASDAGNQ